MQQRERWLAIIAVALIAILGVQWVLPRFFNPLRERRQQLTTLQQQIDERREELAHGRRAERVLKKLAARSLPADQDVARTRYQNWLASLAEEAGFQKLRTEPQKPAEISITMDDRRTKHSVGYRLDFTVAGEASLPELVQFLYGFYSRDLLHQLRKVQITPKERGKRLGVDISVQALALNRTANASRLPQAEADRLALDALQDYRQLIVENNPFGPPNHSPTLQPISEQTVLAAQELSVQLEGSDPDGDQLEYRLVKGPAEAKVDPGSGKLQWKPDQAIDASKISVTVAAIDDGVPQRKAQQTFDIMVKPPAESPVASFDAAKQTFITAFTGSSGKPQVWMLEKTSGKSYQLSEGESFQFGDFQATVKRIDKNRSIEIESGDQRLRWPWEKSLSEATVVSPEESPEPAGNAAELQARAG